MTTNIYIANHSSMISTAQLEQAVADLQTQLTRDFNPIWNKDGYLIISNDTPPQGSYRITILNDFDQANVLGYHELTVGGYPQGYVFVDNGIAYGIPWTVSLSHEILEMLVNPECNLTVLTDVSPYQAPNENWLWAMEVCDPVQGVDQTYYINDTAVSDFVYPTWFQNYWEPFSTQFNYQNTIFMPFQLQSGGYAMVRDVVAGSFGWQAIFGSVIQVLTPQFTLQNLRAKLRLLRKIREVPNKPFSRKLRWLTPRQNWRKSNI